MKLKMNSKNLDKKLSILDSKEQKLEKKYKSINDVSEMSKEIKDFINYCLKERQENHSSVNYSSELSKKIMYWGEKFK